MKKKSIQQNKSITILFTHDLHDHLYPFDTLENGCITSRGGYARLKTAIDQEKKSDSELILLDAGDFSMGTLFQTIFTTSCPQLRIMGKLGYDVTTFGNHEFDFREDALASCLRAAIDSRDKLPKIVASNIMFPLDKNCELTISLENLKMSMEDYGVEKYTVINRNNIKIGIFGLFGKDAVSHSPMTEVVFTDAISTSKKMVKLLKEKEQADLIICLSHSGTTKRKWNSEDETLAKKVSDIDLIISGHTHSSFKEPIIVGSTFICSVGEYGENLGKIRLTQNSNKRWDLSVYKLKRIDDNLEINKEVSQSIDTLKKLVEEKYLDNFYMKFDEVLAYTSFNLTNSSPIGDFISDSYMYAVREVESHDYEPVAVTIVPYGMIRDSFLIGDITTFKVFSVFPLGIGPDKISGYPLISAYLTGKELKTLAEIDASIKVGAEVDPTIDLAELYMSGLNYKFNPKRLIFNKVTDVYLCDIDKKRIELRDDTLYRVVTSLYCVQMLYIIRKKSFNVLSVLPKDKYGVKIKDFESHIIYDGEYELKEWLAIARYLKSFPKKNNIPQIPFYYSHTKNRKIVLEDKNIFSVLKSPNKIWLTVYAFIALIITLILFLALFIKNLQSNL